MNIKKSEGSHIEYNNLGGRSISIKLFEWLLNNLPKGSTILEFGSGLGTNELVKFWEVYSVEQDENWLNSAFTNYIYAPIKGGWYDADKVFNSLPKNYDAVIIDGPKGGGSRMGILNYLDKIDTDAIIIVDDVNRPGDLKLFDELCNKLEDKNYFVKTDDSKKIGILI